MRWKTKRRPTVVTLVALLLPWLCTGVLRADPADDFQRLDQQCWDQMKAGNYHEAERMALRLKQMAEGPLADQPLYVACASNTLGVLYWYQGRYADAEPLLKRSLALREKVLGTEHPTTPKPCTKPNSGSAVKIDGKARAIGLHLC